MVRRYDGVARCNAQPKSFTLVCHFFGLTPSLHPLHSEINIVTQTHVCIQGERQRSKVKTNYACADGSLMLKKQGTGARKPTIGARNPISSTFTLFKWNFSRGIKRNYPLVRQPADRTYSCSSPLREGSKVTRSEGRYYAHCVPSQKVRYRLAQET